MPILFVNGKRRDLHETVLPVLDRAYLYGEGLFETFRSYNGKIAFLDEHLKRFYAGAEFLHIAAPSKKQVLTLLEKLLKNEKKPNTYIKLILSSTSSTIRLSKTHEAKPMLVAYLDTFEPYPHSLYTLGVEAIIVRSVRNDPPPLCWYKTTNYLAKVIARREVEKKGAWEGILLNPSGQVSEGSISNVFWVVNGRVYTPSLKAGCLPGVTRAVILKALHRAKIPCLEIDMRPTILQEANEILITNSLFEILPVVSLDGKKVGTGRPGSFFKKIKQLYAASVRLEVSR